MRASDYGSPGDVFQVGDRFGYTGKKIWDNHELVQWTAWSQIFVRVPQSSRSILLVILTPLSLPRNPIVVMGDEPIVADFFTIGQCMVEVDVSSTGDVLIPPHDHNSTKIQLIEITNSTSKKEQLKDLLVARIDLRTWFL